jgi:TRAP-type C4-dicarboxylate transport system substrate-binding protein
MKGKKTLGIVLALALFAFWAGQGLMDTPAWAAEKTFTLKIGSGHPTAAKWIEYMAKFYIPKVVKRVKDETKYELVFSEQWGGSVAKLGEVLEATEIGLLDIGADIIVFEPTKLYLHNYPYNIPFSTGDPAAVARITAKLFKKFPIFGEILKKYNLRLLSAASAGDSYDLILNFSCHKAGDVKGHKIAGAGANLPWISGVGAIPVQSNLVEAYTSLQTGVYEGWIMTATGTVSFKLNEICKHFTVMDFGAASQLLVYINSKSWAKLPPEVQKILQEESDLFTVKEPEYVQGQHIEAMKVLKDSGEVYVMPFEEKVKWANQMIDLPARFAKEADAKGWPGTAIAREAIKLNEEEGVKYPRKWMSK